jgi:hypothetical protein
MYGMYRTNKEKLLRLPHLFLVYLLLRYHCQLQYSSHCFPPCLVGASIRRDLQKLRPTLSEYFYWDLI